MAGASRHRLLDLHPRSEILLALRTLVAAIAGFLLIHGRRANALLLLATSVGAALISAGLKFLFAAVYLTLGALLAREYPQTALRRFFMAVAITLTVLIGSSRVYLGVHWPSDVLAGWAIGTFWAWACWKLARQT